MPKTENTRKQRAQQLLQAAIKGPDFSDTFVSRYQPCHARDTYLIWADTWLIPELKRLIPELREFVEPAGEAKGASG